MLQFSRQGGSMSRVNMVSIVIATIYKDVCVCVSKKDFLKYLPGFLVIPYSNGSNFLLGEWKFLNVFSP